MYYVYLLRSKNFDQVYTGVTQDLKVGLAAHNSGQSPHTRKFKPWKLVVYVAFENDQAASAFESYLKTGSGIAFARRHLLK